MPYAGLFALLCVLFASLHSLIDRTRYSLASSCIHMWGLPSPLQIPQKGLELQHLLIHRIFVFVHLLSFYVIFTSTGAMGREV